MSTEDLPNMDDGDQSTTADIAGSDASVEDLVAALTQAANQQTQQAHTQQAGNTAGCHQVTDNLVITQDPDYYALTSEDGEYRGLTKYDDAPQTEVPPDRSYISGEHSGSVATKEELCRGLRSQNSCPMLIGDAGTAKNTSIDSVYSTLNQPVYRMQMGSGLTVFDLFAETELRDGETVTTLKPFGKATVFGGVAVIDEINLADANLVAHFNAMAEQEGQRRVTLPGTGITLTDLPDDTEWDADKHLGKYIHPEFRVVATRNPPSYTGAEKINNALNDRFSPIRYEYPDADVESKLLAEEIGADPDQILPLLEVVNREIRNARANNTGPKCPVSFRRLVDALEYAKCHDTTIYNGAMEKIVGYAQSAGDREYIEGSINDNKAKLDVTLDTNGGPATYECENCSHEIEVSSAGVDAEHGVCPSCDAPYMRNDKWKTNYRSSHVARFRWVENGTNDPNLIVSFWSDSDNKLTTYRYDGVEKSDYEDLCDAQSVGRVMNGIKNKPRITSEKIGEAEGLDKPKTINS